MQNRDYLKLNTKVIVKNLFLKALYLREKILNFNFVHTFYGRIKKVKNPIVNYM